MNCLKCGRETGGEQVFCEDCLLEMAKYPVKPGTAVKLPERREPAPFRRALKRRTVSPEEQVKILRKRNRHLILALLISLITIALLIYPALCHLVEDHYKPGQNYSVVTTATESTIPTETTAP